MFISYLVKEFPIKSRFTDINLHVYVHVYCEFVKLLCNKKIQSHKLLTNIYQIKGPANTIFSCQHKKLQLSYKYQDQHINMASNKNMDLSPLTMENKETV